MRKLRRIGATGCRSHSGRFVCSFVKKAGIEIGCIRCAGQGQRAAEKRRNEKSPRISWAFAFLY
ncbi:MAG: hypothetical protein SOY88_03755 [Massilioclostridium sp.]|nr:hypothetical protein [Massilioclostridium sp.]